MVVTEAAIVELGTPDAAAAMALSQEAHWNQTEDDWLLFLTQGKVFGIRDGEGALVATAALLPFGGGQAWLSMVLVTAQARRKGLATRLVQACLDVAAAQGLTSWLDATRDGAEVYGRMGFSTVTTLHRMRHAGTGSDKDTVALTAGTVGELLVRDRDVAGFDRGDLLHSLAGRKASHIAMCGRALGLVRDGRVARHIGPVFADDAASALDLVTAIVAAGSAPHMLDAAAAEEAFVTGLTACGWTLERSFLRMRFGQDRSATERLPFAVAGPEFG